MEIAFSYVFAAGLCIGYGFLIGVTVRQRERLGMLYRWLLLTLIVALLGKAINILVPDSHLGPYSGFFVGGLTQPSVYVLLASLLPVAFAALTLRFLQRRSPVLAVIFGSVWWIALVIASVQVPDKTILLGQPGWITQSLTRGDALGQAVLAGWAVAGLLMLLASFYTFLTAHLPEIFNRALFWLTIVPLIIMGELLGTSGSLFLKEIGWLVQFVGMIGAVYGALSHSVFDVRKVFRASLTSVLTTGGAAAVAFLVLVAASSLGVNVPNRFLALIVLALASALAYIPIRGAVVLLMNRIFGTVANDDPTAVIRGYSQDIAGVVELDELNDLAIEMLRRTMRARRGGLILATRDDNETVRVEPMPSKLGDMPEIRGWIPKDSAVHGSLFEQRRPVRQYDLEFSREYTNVPLELISFFKALKMSAYAPILVQGQVIGLLAAGAKTTDEPYSPQDLQLLSTIAAQTGVALRNARLVSDLRFARDKTQELNEDISKTKERLEELDKVKTDFITIASHELRTPLAQIRGYTDILDAVNDQGGMDPDQITGLTNNLRKATDRLEQLIADMLDVSQLGLDAMDLRFAPTTIDNVIRLAIEPLSEAINQRKLQLTARGLKALPQIQADMQRLVQAFRNIVLNAIKYTPDGGRIDISARVQQNERTKKDEIVVSVKDTGIGIDPKFHDLIFEKFFRIADPGLHSTGATKFMGAGPGLGLTIARGMVEGHAGKIWVESGGHDTEKLPGTTVNVLLPVSPPESARRVKPFEATPSGRLLTPTKTLGKLE